MNLTEIDIHTHKFEKNFIGIKNICIGVKNKVFGYFSAGLHPWHIEKYYDKNLSDLFFHFSLLKNFKAVGEIGLDASVNIETKVQEQIFTEQLNIAERLDKPVILHCVRCYDKLLFFRKKYKQTPWIIHDFKGNYTLASQLLKSNIFLSFGNFLMNNHKKTIETFEKISLDKIFLETDTANYYITDVYRKASEIKKTDYNELKQIIFNNFNKIFGI